MARISLVAALWATVAAAQTIQPLNATLDSAQANSETQLSLVASPPLPGPAGYNIAPLSTSAGAGQSLDQLAVCLPPVINFRNALTISIENHILGDYRAVRWDKRGQCY